MMIYNEDGEEDTDWWENGTKKKTKVSTFNTKYIIDTLLFALYT